MTTPSITADETTPLATRLESIAFGVLAILPVAMVVANRSATAIILLAAVCAAAAAYMNGTIGEGMRRAAAILAPASIRAATDWSGFWTATSASAMSGSGVPCNRPNSGGS